MSRIRHTLFIAPMLALGLLLASLMAQAQEAAAAPAGIDQAAFRRCLVGLVPIAAKQGVSAATFEHYTRDLAPDPSVLVALDHQPEFTTQVWDYLSGLVDQERVDDGKARLAQWGEVLDRVRQRYGVDPATVVAVWGVESNYGQQFGKRPLVTSLATLSCEGRRQAYFRGEFYATLRILQSGDIKPEQFNGSWAGAFGHTQFMPSTFERVAVDFDGDGRRDLIGSVPDALASTAHYLQLAHWQPGLPWGYEVKLPEHFDSAISGREAKQPLSYWRAHGVRRIDGTSLDDSAVPAGLLLPAGATGPAFLVFRNFDAVFAYNASISYTLAIGLLSDRLRGLPGLQAHWPTDDPGTSRAERRELQRLLIARGHDIGEPDGMIGDKTREAIQQEQHRLGLPADGRAGQRILAVLRKSP